MRTKNIALSRILRSGTRDEIRAKRAEIKTMLEKDTRIEVAKKLKVHPRTLYRWLGDVDRLARRGEAHAGGAPKVKKAKKKKATVSRRTLSRESKPTKREAPQKKAA